MLIFLMFCIMRRCLLYIFLLLSFSLYSQSYNKSFIMNVTQEGNLYFIYDLKMKSQTEDVKSLEFDYTFVESRDYVTLTATCISKNVVSVDSLSLLLPTGCKYSNGVDKIYTERKSQWHTRFHCNIDYDFWMKMYDSDTPFQLVLQDKNGVQIIYEDSKKGWKKNKKKMQSIQEIISVNRE